MLNFKTCKSGIQKFLKEECDSRKKNGILPTENIVIVRLLDNEFLALDFYTEVCKTLNYYQVKHLILASISTAAFYNPKALKEMKQVKDELITINEKIAKEAFSLARLLKKREELSEYGFSSSEFYSIIQPINIAASENYLYKSYVKEQLAQLKCQFDLKYWPDISDVVLELSYDAEHSRVEATDNVAYEAMSSGKLSLTSFFKALYEAIEMLGIKFGGCLPDGFSLSDKAMASLANSILELEQSQMIEASYVKRLRQRLRES